MVFETIRLEGGIKKQVQDKVTRKKVKLAQPPTQAIIQHCVVGLKHNYSIKPSLRKEITAMVVHNVSPFFHQILKLITNLQNKHAITGTIA